MFVTMVAVLEEWESLTMFKNTNLLSQIISFTYILTFTLGICLTFLACSSADTLESTVIVGQSRFVVEVADEPNERMQGLSGRENLNEMSGMLFIFEAGEATNFWMKGMMFPVDIIWIAEECVVVDADVDVPVPLPGAPNSDLALYTPMRPAAYAMELNAGEVARYGVKWGLGCAHDILMARLYRHVADKRMLRMIRRFLEAGMMQEGLCIPRRQGTSQEGPLSPLLENLLLDDLDKELERRGHRFCRYADDCNIYVGSKAAGDRVLASASSFKKPPSWPRQARDGGGKHKRQ